MTVAFSSAKRINIKSFTINNTFVHNDKDYGKDYCHCNKKV